MDWSQLAIREMRLEARFGDRVVPAFSERPKSIWAIVSDAASRNPDGEALICGAKLLIRETTLADRVPDARDVPELMHRIPVDDGGNASQFSVLAARGMAAVQP